MTAESRQPHRPYKNLRTAYILLVLAGFVGAHRMYLERWFSALAYPLVFFASLVILSELTLVVLIGVILLVDAAVLPRLTDRANEKVSENLAKDPDFYRHRTEQEVAPWALSKKSGFWYALQAPMRVISFILLPMLFTLLIVLVETHELVVFPVIILLATGLVTSLDQLAHRHPTMLQLPGVEAALEHVKQMKTYYWANEPPLRTPWLRVFTRATSEFKPYWKIVGLMILAIALDLALSFSDDYSPYLGFEHALPIVITQILIFAYAVLILLSHLSALSFHYSLSGKRLRLRFLTVIALAATGLSFALAIVISDDEGWVPPFSELRLEERMKNDEYKSLVRDYSSMFIKHYKPEDGKLCNDKKSRNLCEPTKKLRKLLSGIAPNSESEAFEVFDETVIAGDSEVKWRGVRYLCGEPKSVIAAYSVTQDILCDGLIEKSDKKHADICKERISEFSKLPVVEEDTC